MGRGTGIHVRMRARDTAEAHRASSPLELLYDLVFVVAVGTLVAELARSIGTGDVLGRVVPFLFVFFAIWWAWINFTWFGSAYDTDDVAYRLLVVVQMAGVLVLAAGVAAAFDDVDFTVVTIGYVIMRIGQLGLWARAAVEHPATRATSVRYLVAVAVIQVAWVLRLLLPEPWMIVAVSVALGVLEVLTPPWAQRAGDLAWHPHHIAERYGLFVIILLGESVLAAVAGLQAALAARGVTPGLVVVAVAGLVLLVALWWVYFLQPAGEGLAERRRFSFVWGYGHYLLFAALAAVGAGLEAAVRMGAHPRDGEVLVASLALAIPTALAFLLIWALHAPLLVRCGYPAGIAIPTAALVLVAGLLAPWIGMTGVALVIAVVAAASVALAVIRDRTRASAPATS